MNRRISIVALMGLLFFGISVPTAISAESTPSPSAVPVSTARAVTPTPSPSVADKAAAAKAAADKAAADKLTAAKAAADKAAAKAAADKAAAKAAADKAASQSCVGCTIGKVGPGGGIIFYDAGSQQKWGRYLEAAPANWSGSVTDPKTLWCNINNALLSTGANKTLGTAIGQGRPNTDVMRARCSSGAGGLAISYHGGGKSDWFLPSKDELNVMYANRSIIGGLAADSYWSSSEDYALAAWFQSVADGSTGSVMKSTNEFVRPIRAY